MGNPKTKADNSKFVRFNPAEGGTTRNSKLFQNVYVVIMAGGKGERFWPLSTESVPKPFLKIVGDKTLIQLTVERASKVVPLERVFVVLGQQHLDVAQKQLEILPDENFIIEPEGRDTAPCIGYSALYVLKQDKKAVMVVLPADQFIPDADNFAKTISVAIEFAKTGDYLVTVGIKPVRPETGYGYINTREPFKTIEDNVCYRVSRYVEKPDIETAKKYIHEGNYYWNGGIFIWHAKAVIAGIKRHMPELYKGLMNLKNAMASKDSGKTTGIYKNLQRKSIDYGLMEKADNVLMVPAQFNWDDVGAWSSLLRVLKLDENGNYVKGNTISIDTKDCVISGEDVIVGTIGVSNLVIVVSKEGILVCNADRAQEVREIAKQLPEK
jgi:mannose-1-phosphate guanylyltransferase